MSHGYATDFLAILLVPPCPTRYLLYYLARHGETAWSRTGQHTGLTDLPLTDKGQAEALQLGERLRELTFSRILVSPLARARQTCELAGFGAKAEIEPDLVEWNYGQYEGRRTHEIRADRPDWQLFRDGCPGGESVAEIGARADRVIAKSARLQRGGAPLLERPYLARLDRAMAWARRQRRQVLSVQHGEPEHAGLRAQSVGAGDSALERQLAGHSSCRSAVSGQAVDRPTLSGSY